MSRPPTPLLPTLDDLIEREPDFVNDGTISYCRHCGVEKDASNAKFFIEHFRECVEPRTREPRQ